MSKDITQKTTDSVIDKTIVIPQDKLPQGQQPAVTGQEASNDLISPGNLIQAFSDLFFSRRTIPDDLISVIQDKQEAVPDSARMPCEPETSKKLPDVQSVYSISDAPIYTGGQGFISRASDLALGCTVAMKTLHAHYNSNPGARQSFINEDEFFVSGIHNCPTAFTAPYGFTVEESDGCCGDWFAGIDNSAVHAKQVVR